MQPSPAPPEALLEHLDWVRQLARSLVADPNAADDLVQEAWISAARRPPHAGNLRGWLAQVVRNAARDRRRKESRHALHERRGAKPEATSSGDELADCVATQQRLVQCVLQLEEPYRETVLLRYFQELAPKQIAARTGVPVATVKTRLRRALAELRSRLDRASGGDGRAWMLALMPLTQAPASLGTVGTGTLLIMSTKSVALVTLALAVAGLGVFLWMRDAGVPEDTMHAGITDATPAQVILATSGEASARTALPAGESGANREKVEIGLDATVRVRVVDGLATPLADVNVDVWRLTTGTGDSHHVAQALTRAPDGIATFDDLLQREPEFNSSGSWAVVAVDGAFVPPVRTQFDPRQPPSEPLELVLPPSGRVVVLVKSADGRPLPDGDVSLVPSVPQVREGGRFVRGLSTERTTRQGRAVFEHVGIGHDIEVHAQPSQEWPERTVRRAGPLAVGEEVVVTVEFDEPLPVLVGRLLDSTGAIRPRESLSGRVVLTRPGRAAEKVDVHRFTDAEGRFRIPVETDLATEVHCTLHVRLDGSDHVDVLTAEVAVPEPLRGGDNPIGDVLLSEPAVERAVLSGTVRDTRGAPIDRALIEIARRRPGAQPFGQPNYDRIPDQRAISDAHGRYAVTAELSPGEYLVDVLCDGYVATGMQPFTPGTRGHDVVLQRWGALEGSVRIPDGIAADGLVVEAWLPASEPRRSDGTGWSSGSARPLPNGTFRIDRIPPGRIDVRVRLQGEDESLALIEGVEVPEGGATTDPRLNPVDLRGSMLRPIRIRIRGPDPTRVPAAAIAVKPAGDADAAPRRILCEDGELLFVSRWPAIDVEAQAADLRTVRREAVTADVTITMEPGLPFTVRLPADIELPAKPDDLTLLLIPTAILQVSREERLFEEDSGREHELYYWLSSQAQRFDARRELTFRLPEAGPYSIEFSVERRDHTDSRHSSVELRNDGLELRESDAGRSIELDVGPDEVLAARARMR